MVATMIGFHARFLPFKTFLSIPLCQTRLTLDSICHYERTSMAQVDQREGLNVIISRLTIKTLLADHIVRLVPMKPENINSRNGCTGICEGQVTN